MEKVKDHPNVIKIYNVLEQQKQNDQYGEYIYIVMEYADGGMLLEQYIIYNIE